MPTHVTESTGASVTATWQFESGSKAEFKSGSTLETKSGSTLACGGDFDLTGDFIEISEGGTGATTAAGARSNLEAAKSGSNSDITELSGLTTPLSVAQGGTGATILTSGGILIGNDTSAISTASTSTSNAELVTDINGTPKWVEHKEYIGVMCVDPDTSITATSNVAQFHFPFDGYVTNTFAGVNVAGTGTTIPIINIEIEGSSIFTTKLTIDSGETKSSTASTPAVINTGTSNFSKWDLCSIHVDCTGTTPPEGLVVTLTTVKTG